MDDLNVQQLWGISPFVDVLAAARAGSFTQHGDLESAADAAGATAVGNTTAVLQVCPYDCRHTLATASNHSSSCSQQQQHQQLDFYVYETEPEGLCRHVLLLSLLFDARLTARERAEMFLELHGNVMLRQGTADWVCAASRWLEAAMVGQLPSKQQERQSPVQAFLQVFDFSLLKYKERDLLLETFQQYRSKLGFDMAGAWQGRCRKWYADRYDFRDNMVDWDYHMRLGQRGTPFLDPGLGIIIHPYHFKHWRLTGVAYELRESSYTATNTSMLATAYGRTKEFKDRYLRDVGRSVSAYGYWGEVLNPPYHAFGTVCADPALLKQVNKQFSHTSMDLAEHNLLGFIKQLCGGKGLAAAATAADSKNSCSSGETHRARAAVGPTSLEQLTAHAAEQAAEGAEQPQQQQSPEQQQVQESASKAGAAAGKECSGASGPSDAAGPADQAACDLQALSVQHTKQQPEQQSGTDKDAACHQKQQQKEQQQDEQASRTSAQADAAVQQAAAELEQLTAAVQQLTASVRIFLLTGDLKRSLTGKAAFAGRFAAATVGHRHVHLLGPEYGLAGVMQDSAPVLVETAANLVQLNGQQVAAFEGKLLELAAAAGFRKHPASTVQQQAAMQATSGQAPADTDTGASSVDRGTGSRWCLPPGHLALQAQH